MRLTRAAVSVLVAAGMVGCAGPQEAPVPLPTMVPTVPSAVAPPGTAQAVPVYYAAQTPAGLRLYREFHRVQTADPASDAVREMFGRPIDPDYRTLWPSGVGLAGPVTAAGGVVTVDLTGVDGTQVSAAAAPFAVQQLVLTVQGARQSTDPVRVLVQGKAVDKLWNAVATAAPVPRGDIYALRSPVQIDVPADGSSVGHDVVVSGEASVFEATVHWEILRGTAVLHTGATTTAEGMRFSPFRFTITLPAGEYTVRISEDDPSGGAGRPVLTDDKAFTVTA